MERMRGRRRRAERREFQFGGLVRHREGFFYPEYTSYWTPHQETAAIIDTNWHVFLLSQL